MDPSTDDGEFVEPVARPPRTAAPAVTLSSGSTDNHKPLGDAPGEVKSTVLTSPTSTAPRVTSSVAPSDNDQASTVQPNSPAAATPTKPKIFLKSSSPDVPLHIHLASDLPHSLARRLRIAIRAHGGLPELHFGKADLIVVDPDMFSLSKRLLRDANQMGQPIPVVTYHYIQDSVAQAVSLDVQDPKYKFDGTQPDSTATPSTLPPSRSLNGRNPFTESDRQAIIDYFIDKHEATWSLSAAAKELAATIQTHTYSSFQSHLQANFEKGWNLKQQILNARRAALEDEPSELQARILRSQYTASPGIAEQSAPSDGWPRASPEQQRTGSAETSSQDGQHILAQTHEEASPSAATDQQEGHDDQDEEDLAIKQPNPGLTFQTVERSPTKIRQTVDHDSTQRSSADLSPPASASRLPSIELPPGQRLDILRSPSVLEESDPEEYSPNILSQIQQGKSSRQQPSKKQQQQRSPPSDSSEDSELDQLDRDSDEDLLTTGPELNAPEAHQHRSDDSRDSEWHGSRRIDRQLRERDPTLAKDTRIKFTQDEKDKLLHELARHVYQQGREPQASTQDAILAKPQDIFWEQFAIQNPSHSAMSWRSHYLKNRPTYRQMIELLIDEMNDESQGEPDERDEARSVGAEDYDEQRDQQHDQQNNSADPLTSSVDKTNGASTQHSRPDAKSDTLYRTDEMSLPPDGIVVMIPQQPALDDDSQRPSKTRSPIVQRWGRTPTPPPWGESEEAEEGEEVEHPEEADEEEDEDDVMQVEAEVDAVVEYAEPTQASDGDTSSSSEAANPALPDELEHDQASAKSTGERRRDSVGSPDARRRQGTSVLSTPSRSAPSSQHRPVDAGTPVLVQHRDAPFYDFTIDSDEEQRIRKARSRPSLPDLRTRGQEAPSKKPASPVSTDRFLDHFATPVRGEKRRTTRNAHIMTSDREDGRIRQTREWAESISASPSSASPELPRRAEHVVVSESSRKRASRIDRRLLLDSTHVSNPSPQLQQGIAQQHQRNSSSADVPTISPSPSRIRQDQASAARDRRSSKSGIEAARLQYRAEVERFRSEFGLDKEQLRNLLMRFQASVKDARNYIAFWLGEMEETYGVEAAVAFEYVKTSQGDFDQAETFLKLASRTRSTSIPARLGGASSRSASHSVSPAKRSARENERRLSRIDQQGSRAESSKRYRR